MSARTLALEALRAVGRSVDELDDYSNILGDPLRGTVEQAIAALEAETIGPRIDPEVVSVLQRAADAIHEQDGKSIADEKLVDDYDALMRRLLAAPPEREAMTDAWLNKEFSAAITVAGPNVAVSLRSFAVRVLMAHGDQEGVRQGLVQVGKQRMDAQATESYLLAELQTIANADPLNWDAPDNNHATFHAWAQSRARAAIAKVVQP